MTRKGMTKNGRSDTDAAISVIRICRHRTGRAAPNIHRACSVYRSSAFRRIRSLVDAFAAVLLHNFAQCSIDVLRHAARVTAHEEVRPFGVEPFPDLGRVFHHPVLHVDFLG